MAQNDRTASGLQTWSWQIGRGATPLDPNATFNTTLTTLTGGGNWTQQTTNPDGTSTLTTHTAGLIDQSETFDANNNLIASTAMRNASNTSLSGYDSINRPTHQRHSRTGVTTTEYLSLTADIVSKITDPGNRVTAFTHDLRGRQTSVNAPDTLDANGNNLTNITNTFYHPDSTIQETSGAQTYRTTYTYDYADRQKTLTTYGNGTANAVTTWIYSPTRGFLIEKNYHGETDDPSATPADADYTYTAAGRLKTRQWERGVLTTYTYDNGAAA